LICSQMQESSWIIILLAQWNVVVFMLWSIHNQGKLNENLSLENRTTSDEIETNRNSVHISYWRAVLHFVISRKLELFTGTAMRTSNLTYWILCRIALKTTDVGSKDACSSTIKFPVILSLSHCCIPYFVSPISLAELKWFRRLWKLWTMYWRGSQEFWGRVNLQLLWYIYLVLNLILGSNCALLISVVHYMFYNVFAPVLFLRWEAHIHTFEEYSSPP
jgi:hypothetical protein